MYFALSTQLQRNDAGTPTSTTAEVYAMTGDGGLGAGFGVGVGTGVGHTMIGATYCCCHDGRSAIGFTVTGGGNG